MTPPDGIEYRPATAADLASCEEIWRESLNDYLLPLGQQEIPPDNAALRLLHAHALATDPDRFWVATSSFDPGPAGGGRDVGAPEAGAPEAGASSGRSDVGASRPGEPRPGQREVIAFASALQRDRVWYLSMLFVRPGRQLGGIGRGLLERTMPAAPDTMTLAVATDPAQPISNGLYASVGMAPRLPMFNLIGRPTRPTELATLPPDVVGARFDETSRAISPAEAPGLDAELDALDRSLLGFAHPQDHAFVRRQGRIGFAYRDAGGSLAGYGYTSEVGRIGPVAARDTALLAPIVADLLTSVRPRGVSAIWVSGDSGPTMQMLLRAGLRMEGFPVLVGWTRPFADFGRYIPISPGIL